MQSVAQHILGGENVAFIGAPGSGKTTALRECLKYIDPSYGIISMFTTELSQFKNILYLSEDQGFNWTCPNWIHIVPETILSNSKVTEQALAAPGSLITTIQVPEPKDGEDIVQLFNQRCDQLALDPAQFSVIVWACIRDGQHMTRIIYL